MANVFFDFKSCINSIPGLISQLITIGQQPLIVSSNAFEIPWTFRPSGVYWMTTLMEACFDAVFCGAVEVTRAVWDLLIFQAVEDRHHLGLGCLLLAALIILLWHGVHMTG
jgi:hypothetical protein